MDFAVIVLTIFTMEANHWNNPLIFIIMYKLSHLRFERGVISMLVRLAIANRIEKVYRTL